MDLQRRLVTADDLVTDLGRLGVRHGTVLLAHCSLSSLGWVAGGEQAVVEALRRVLGPAGTLVMPAQSWQLCDPAYLNDPAVPRDWWPAVRKHLPAWDPASGPASIPPGVARGTIMTEAMTRPPCRRHRLPGV